MPGWASKSYAWSTSPLRRYTDLVNQWQIIAAARHGKTAALAAPFKPKDADLFSILSGFDAAYSSYNAYQAGMERFWTLKYLQQQGIGELEATVVKDQPNACWCAPIRCRWCFRWWAPRAWRAARGCAWRWATSTRSRSTCAAP